MRGRALALCTVLCMTLWAVMAQAQDAGGALSGNDYAGLFERYADQVEQPAPDQRILELDGPVILREVRRADGRLRYTAVDQSSGGAAGCLLRVLAEASAVVKSCPDVLPKAAGLRLNASLRRAAQFYAENAYPKRDLPVLEAQIAAFIDGRTSSSICSALKDDQMQFLEALSSPSSQRSIEKSLAQPRLPVMHPCL